MGGLCCVILGHSTRCQQLPPNTQHPAISHLALTVPPNTLLSVIAQSSPHPTTLLSTQALQVSMWPSPPITSTYLPDPFTCAAARSVMGRARSNTTA